MSTHHKNHIFKLVLSAMFLAMAMVFPWITGQISELGNAFLPMHIPILLCGFFCGPIYGVTLGALAPYLRFILFGAPTLMPIGIAMSFELATYGLMAGLLYQLLPKNPLTVYISLIGSMVMGRIVWGAARVLLYDLGKVPFGWEAFLSGAFFMAIPGIIIQLVLIPPLVILLSKIFPKLGGKYDMKKKKSKKTIVLEWLGIFVEVTPVIIAIYYAPDIGNAVLTFLGIHPTNMTLGIVSIAFAGFAVVALSYLLVRGIICLILRIIRSFKRKSKETSDNL